MVKRFFKEKKCVAGMIMLLLLILVSVFCEQLAPYEPDAGIAAEHLMPPSSEHLFGQDGMEEMYYQELFMVLRWR